MTEQRVGNGEQPETINAATGGDGPVGGGRARRIAFKAILVLTTAFLLVWLLPAYWLIVIDWLPRDALLAIRTDHVVGEEVHRLHSLALGVLAWGMLAGVALQFHRPRRKVAALLVALAVPIAISAADAVIGTHDFTGIAPFLLSILLVCTLHPAAREFVRPPRLHWPLVILVLVAGMAWIPYSLTVAEMARETTTPFEIDHLKFVVSFGPLAILWGLIASTDKAGWRIAGFAVVFLTACVALQSLIYPGTLSRVSPPWAWAGLAWCLAFGATAWSRADTESKR